MEREADDLKTLTNDIIISVVVHYYIVSYWNGGGGAESEQIKRTARLILSGDFSMFLSSFHSFLFSFISSIILLVSLSHQFLSCIQ